MSDNHHSLKLSARQGTPGRKQLSRIPAVRGPWLTVALRPRSSVVVDWKLAQTAAERRQTLANWHRRGYGTDEVDLGLEPAGALSWDEPLELALRLLLTVSELEFPREAIDALADYALSAVTAARKTEVEA